MEELSQLFQSCHLPYKFVDIPSLDDPPSLRDHKLKFYVNKIITKLSTSAFEQSGFEQTEDETNWNCSWGRQFTLNRYSTIKSWQKCNHFAAANLMGRKDHFHDRMTELKERVGAFANFYPESYLLPKDQQMLNEAWKTHKLWIIKKAAASRGEGVEVVDSSQSEVPTANDFVIQHYIERPFLITGRKFDLRIYVLVTSIAPLRIYMYNSGLVRFATRPYDPNAPTSEKRVHLTNFALNKDDENFKRAKGDITREMVEDSKWSLPFFFNYLKQIEIDPEKVKRELERVSIATVIGGMTVIRNHHARIVQHRQNSWELYGIDVLLDADLNAYVLEINISPGMSGEDSPLDAAIKGKLMRDTLRMGRIIDCNCDERQPCKGIDVLERIEKASITRQRHMAIESGRENGWEHPVFSDILCVHDFMQERERLGGFRRVFPKRKTVDMFLPCFDRMKYHDIVFIDWIKKTNEERLNAIKSNWELYNSEISNLEND